MIDDNAPVEISSIASNEPSCSSYANILSPTPTDTTESDDLAIARALQAEFDLEYDEELKKIEQSRNKSKIVKFAVRSSQVHMMSF